MSTRRSTKNINASEVSERIIALKRSRSGHLGELTKIYRRLEEYFKDYEYTSEVRSGKDRLSGQWYRYLQIHYEILEQLTDEREILTETSKHKEHKEKYQHFMKSIDDYLSIGEVKEEISLLGASGISRIPRISLDDTGIPMRKFRDVDDDELSIGSGILGRSNFSRASSKAREDSRLERILAEKKLKQLKASKERRMKEERLRLENEIADAEDAAELARTKEDFYTGESDDEQGEQQGSKRAVKTGQEQDESRDMTTNTNETEQEERLPDDKFESKSGTPQIKRVEHSASNVKGASTQTVLAFGETEPRDPKPKITESSSTLNTRSVSIQASPIYSSTPARTQPENTEFNLNASAIPYTPAWFSTAPTRATGQSGPPSTTETMIERITSGIDSIVTRSNLPPLDVVKFCGEPHEYFKFKARFHEMVESQNISEVQKMSRLLQYLDGPARLAVAGFEGVPGGLRSALKLLEQRFGHPHIVAKSCVDTLINGPNMSSTDRQALQEFADRSRTLYETLKSMDALSEMNMSNLSKMSSKLPISLQVKWRDEAQRIRERGQFPNLKNLVNFIERQADAANDPIFGRIGESFKSIPKPIAKTNRRPAPTTALSSGAKVTTLSTQVESPSQRSTPLDNKNTSNASESTQAKCYICGSAHKIENCSDFISKSVRQRCVQARQKGLCLNCLRKGHFVTQCQSKFRCKECQLPHHTLLHKGAEDKDANNTPNNIPTASGTHVVTTNASTSGNKPSYNYASTSTSRRIALQVVPIQVLSKEGRSVSTYALLDTGSEETFISRDITDKLNVEINKYDDLAVCTLSGESSVKVGRTDLKVKGVGEEYDTIVQIKDVKVVENLNINTTRPKDISRWSHLKDIIVPDVELEQVLMLIGVNVPEALIHLEHRTGKHGEPYAVRTSLGWAILGPIDNADIHSSNVNVNFVKYGSELCDQQMSQFLRLEDADVNKSSRQAMSIEDQESLKRLKESTRVVDSHYEVGMLWKSNEPWLPDNKGLAEARLQSLKKKLKRDEKFHQKYRDFMNNLLSKGYARKLSEEEARSRSKKTWYLPHHAVFHPQRKEKIRVVFDAAATYNGVSLNNRLNQGPDLSNSLLGVLLRCRQERIALVADIEGMFNQVKVPPEDADALRFLWFADDNLEEAAEYQMTSHIFGAADSPSCANYCLKRVAEDNRGKASEAALSAIENDFYVDDLVKSVGTPEEAKTLTNEITTPLGKAGFRLTKWMSNCREVLATVPEEESQTHA